MKKLIPLALSWVLLPSPAAAQEAGAPATSAGASQAAKPAEGEVRRIDRERQRITIRHGVIPSLDMPPMTMVFQVQDPVLLDRVKVGDKIRFDAVKNGNVYTVTRLEPAP
jgi:Cu(I)/Ag(I) efflux system periplasmic protein CusF